MVSIAKTVSANVWLSGSALSPVAMIVFTSGNGANGRSLTTVGLTVNVSLADRQRDRQSQSSSVVPGIQHRVGSTSRSNTLVAMECSGITNRNIIGINFVFFSEPGCVCSTYREAVGLNFPRNIQRCGWNERFSIAKTVSLNVRADRRCRRSR